MGKEALRIAGVGLNFVAFGFLLVAIYSDHWHEVGSNSSDNLVTSQNLFEGLWNTCSQGATGHWECFEQPGKAQGQSSFGMQQASPRLPFVFYIYRGFSIISVVLSFTGMCMFMAGLEGIRLSKGDKNMKLKISGGLNGLCFCLIITVVVLFRLFQWDSMANMGMNLNSGIGYGMWCAIGTVIFSLAAAVLGFMGIEDDRGIYAAAPSFEPSAGANTYI